MAKRIYDDLLVAKPIGIFCFKNELREFTSEVELRQIVKVINDRVDKNSEVKGYTFTPHFSFTMEAEKLTIEVSSAQPNKQPNLYEFTLVLRISDYGKFSTRLHLELEDATTPSSKKPIFKRAGFRAKHCM